MHTIIIVDKVSRQIQTSYQAEAPNQSAYGGPWGNPNIMVHLQVPDGMFVDALILSDDGNGGISISEDSNVHAQMVAARAVASTELTVRQAKSFGDKLIVEFAAENIRLGIIGDNMTETVLDNMAGIITALSTGSLLAAISRAKSISEDKKDAKYITDARLLAAVNKIEAHLGLTLSTSLN